MKIKRSFIIPFSVTAAAGMLHLFFCLSAAFSDAYNSTVGSAVRIMLANLTGWLPFSLAEIFLYSLPVLTVILAVLANNRGGKTGKRLLFVLKPILYILISVYILFVLTFASGYNGSSLDVKLEIEQNDVSARELYETLCYVTEKTNEAAKEISYAESGASEMPYGYDKLSSEIYESYSGVYDNYGLSGNFRSGVKKIIISPLMTYTHISGVYSFFTGEANINTNYPDYVTAFSAAHEMAHQRGIAKENEANFMAYLVCIESDDAYLRYSGYLSMFNYLSSALKNADYELYTKAVSSLCDEAVSELRAYSEFFEKYRENTASKVSDAVNDTYLKVQGTEGVQSYGMVVDLAVAYHKTDK